MKAKQEEKIAKMLALARAIKRHPIRRRILAVLADKRMNVTELNRKLKLEQAVVSQQLTILRRSDIVIGEKEGKFVYYFVNPVTEDKIEEILKLI